MLVGVGIATLMAATALSVAATGNNGTLKVHEQYTPANTENNDPKVCVFNFEGYGFDVGQDGLIVITTHGDGNNRETAKSLLMPAAKPSQQHGSFTETEYVTLPNGHYKSTVYGKDSRGEYKIDLKAKSKVFKVVCGETSSINTTTPSMHGTTNNQGAAGISTQTVKTKPAHELPAVIAATGTQPLQILLNTLMAGSGAYSASLMRRKSL